MGPKFDFQAGQKFSLGTHSEVRAVGAGSKANARIFRANVSGTCRPEGARSERTLRSLQFFHVAMMEAGTVQFTPACFDNFKSIGVGKGEIQAASPQRHSWPSQTVAAESHRDSPQPLAPSLQDLMVSSQLHFEVMRG